MKRPAIILASAVVPAASVLFLLCSAHAALLLLCLAAAAAAVFAFLVRRGRVFVLCFVISASLVLVSLGSFVRISALDNALKYENTLFRLSGTVITAPVPVSDYRVTFTVRSTAVSSGLIRVSSEEISLLSRLRVGDTVDFDAVGVSLYGGGLSREAISSGITLDCFTVGEVSVGGVSYMPVRRFFSELSADAGERLGDCIGGERGLAAASMVTGSALPASALSENIRTAGIAHYFSVSGFHLSVLTGVLLAIVRLFRLRQSIAFCAVCICCGALCLFTGFEPPVIRASFMCIAVSSSGLLFRRTALPDSLALSASVLLCLNPFAIGEISFLLSYAAVGGISAAARLLSLFVSRIRAEYRVKKLIAALLAPVFFSLGASAATAPACLLAFGWLPLYALPTNLLTSFAVTLLFPLLLLLCCLFAVPFLSDLLVLVCRALLGWLGAVSGAAASLPSARLYTAPALLVLFFIALAVFTAIAAAKRKRRIIPLCSLLLFGFLSAVSAVIFCSSGSGTMKIGLYKSYSLSLCTVEADGRRLLYVFDNSEKSPDELQSALYGRTPSDFDVAVLPDGSFSGLSGSPESDTGAEAFFGGLSVTARKSGGSLAVTAEYDGLTVVLLPEAFSLCDVYKPGFYDIIVSGNDINADVFLENSGVSRLVLFDPSAYSLLVCGDFCRRRDVRLYDFSGGGREIIEVER